MESFNKATNSSFSIALLCRTIVGNGYFDPEIAKTLNKKRGTMQLEATFVIDGSQDIA